MSGIRYSKDHEWVRLEGDVAVCGISDYAQQQLGDVVYVELPEVGRDVEGEQEIAVVESVKAASDVYAPLTGKVTEVNGALGGDPGLVNREPLAGGWFFKLKVADPSQLDGLMDEAAYTAYVEGLA